MKGKLAALCIGLLSGAAAGLAQLPPHISLKQTADMGLAMTGGGTSAWGPADDQVSVRAGAATGQVILQADNRGREGNLAMERACGITNAPTTLAQRRATNRAHYASMIQANLNPRSGPDSPVLQRLRMVASNRMDAFASGYETGAYDTLMLLFELSPNVRASVCATVRNTVAERPGG